jgi:hypothetical protein
VDPVAEPGVPVAGPAEVLHVHGVFIGVRRAPAARPRFREAPACPCKHVAYVPLRPQPEPLAEPAHWLQCVKPEPLVELEQPQARGLRRRVRRHCETMGLEQPQARGLRRRCETTCEALHIHAVAEPLRHRVMVRDHRGPVELRRVVEVVLLGVAPDALPSVRALAIDPDVPPAGVGGVAGGRRVCARGSLVCVCFPGACARLGAAVVQPAATVPGCSRLSSVAVVARPADCRRGEVRATTAGAVAILGDKT